MTEFHWGAIATFIVLTGIYVWAEIYANRVLGPRGGASQSSDEHSSTPAE
jgi:hypothetical protein